MTQEWVSARAVAWVIHDAPVPSDLAFTLTVIAARCDEHGRGSYQSAGTIAEKTGKSASQVERDITRLRELGLILPGDQRLTEHLGGKRPVVYDVPLTLKGAKPVKKSKNPTGKKPSDGASSRMDAGGGMDASSRMDAGPTSRMDAASTSRMDAGQITLLNNPLNNLSPSAPEQGTAPAVVSTAQEREDHQGEDQTPTPKVHGVPADLVRQTMSDTEATAEEFVRVVEAARRAGVHSPGPWLLSKAGKADFQQRLDDLRSAPSAARSGQPGMADYRAAVRAACEHGTPGGADRCPLCRRQAPAQPPVVEDQPLEVPKPRGHQEPAPERDRSGTPTSGRDTSIADVRAQLAKLSTNPIRRRTTPTRLNQASPAEVPSAVAAAHTYLSTLGDGLEWVETAREKLGGHTAPRDEVMVLAATLAHAHHDRMPASR